MANWTACATSGGLPTLTRASSIKAPRTAIIAPPAAKLTKAGTALIRCSVLRMRADREDDLTPSDADRIWGRRDIGSELAWCKTGAQRALCEATPARTCRPRGLAPAKVA